MRQRKIPEIWTKFGDQIHQDFLGHHPDFLSGIMQVYREFDQREQAELFDVISQVCKSDMHRGEKRNFWLQSGAAFGVSDISGFFDEIWQAMAEENSTRKQ